MHKENIAKSASGSTSYYISIH